jgi:ankyrin repeat protein
MADRRNQWVVGVACVVFLTLLLNNGYIRNVLQSGGSTHTEEQPMFRNQPMSSLAAACYSGNVAVAEEALKRDPSSLNREDANGITAIIIASVSG